MPEATDVASLQVMATLIGTVGFPVFIASWVIIRTDKILDRLVTAVELLKECLDVRTPTLPK